MCENTEKRLKLNHNFTFMHIPTSQKVLSWKQDKCMENLRKKEMQVTNGKRRQIQGGKYNIN